MLEILKRWVHFGQGAVLAFLISFVSARSTNIKPGTEILDALLDIIGIGLITYFLIAIFWNRWMVLFSICDKINSKWAVVLYFAAMLLQITLPTTLLFSAWNYHWEFFFGMLGLVSLMGALSHWYFGHNFGGCLSLKTNYDPIKLRKLQTILRRHAIYTFLVCIIVVFFLAWIMDKNWCWVTLARIITVASSALGIVIIAVRDTDLARAYEKSSGGSQLAKSDYS